jgi:bifunctional non-homologous end joining protein LigD
VHYLTYDLLWLEGRSTLEVPYAVRRDLLNGLEISGVHWQTPPHFVGGGEFAREASVDQGLGGVVAKRLDSPYRPGERSKGWLTIANPRDRKR